ncbi:MAG: hypothetical protein J5771_00075 [Bacteroidales bacterium]|nr:hypothetical protein [Bacteroidales bacterium]
MRKIASLFAFAAVLFSCAKQEEMRPSASMGTYTISIDAERQDNEALSKALSVSGKYLSCAWKPGDALSVYNSSRATMMSGKLITQQSGKTDVCFSGSITGTVAAGDILELRWNTPDYARQDGTLSYIANNCDYAYSRVTVSSVSGNTIKVNQKANFTAKQAILRINLQKPDGSAFTASQASFNIKNAITWSSTDPRTKNDVIGEGITHYDLDLYFPELEQKYQANGGNGVVFIALPEGASLTVTAAATDAVSHDCYKKVKNPIDIVAGKFYDIDLKLVAPVDNLDPAPAGWKDRIFDSDLFYAYTDSVSGVKSYYLKSEAIGWDNSQTLYYMGKEFTNDERFLFAMVSPNEWTGDPKLRSAIIIDLATRKQYEFYGSSSAYPYLDPETDQLYYVVRNSTQTDVTLYRRDLLRNPEYDHELAHYPRAIIPYGATKPINRTLNHITISRDKQMVFIDPRIQNSFYWGTLDMYTGTWEEWGYSNEINFTHGQFNPMHDDEALCSTDAWDGGGVHHATPHENDGAYNGAGTIMRMQFCKKGWRETIQPSPTSNSATHDGWTYDGDHIYWMNAGIHKRNVRTKEYTLIYACPTGGKEEQTTHAHPTLDEKYWCYDDAAPGTNGDADWHWYRGAKWRVKFLNTLTGKRVLIYSDRPPITDKAHESTLHPDPHPHFVCNDKYVVCTIAGGADRPRANIHWSITPVDQLIQKTQ